MRQLGIFGALFILIHGSQHANGFGGAGSIAVIASRLAWRLVTARSIRSVNAVFEPLWSRSPVDGAARPELNQFLGFRRPRVRQQNHTARRLCKNIFVSV